MMRRQRGSISMGILDPVTLVIIAMLCGMVAFNGWSTWYGYLCAALSVLSVAVAIFVKATGTDSWP